MNSTVTEAELYTIIMTYGDGVSSRYEVFVGGAIAMIIAIFITKGSLNLYMRAVLILVFSMFSYAQYFTVIGFQTRLVQLVESMRVVTEGQSIKLPSTAGLLANPAFFSNAYLSFISLTMVLTWLCCVILMAQPKLLGKSININE